MQTPATTNNARQRHPAANAPVRGHQARHTLPPRPSADLSRTNHTTRTVSPLMGLVDRREGQRGGIEHGG